MNMPNTQTKSIDDWLTDIQENGDDGTGYLDYAEDEIENDKGDWVCTITGEVMDDFGNIIDEDDNA